MTFPNYFKYSIGFLLTLPFLALLWSCEKEFNPQTTFVEPEIVVEGYIQVGPYAPPPYVILTKSIEYSSNISQDALNDLFVKDAEVIISDGTNSFQLLEVCASDLSFLPPSLQQAIANSIGIPEAALSGQGIDICIYTDLLGLITNAGITPQVGGVYDLTIKTDEFGTITSQTTIPAPVTLDSLVFKDHPTYPLNDSLVELFGYFQDPPGANYYRLFTQRNDESMYAASSRGSNGSVTDDKIFDGQYFQFSIVRGQGGEDFDLNTFGYFERGDTIRVRSSSLDYGSFRFWQTLESNTSSQGPFGNYVRIESNINGGLGVWGGSSYTETTAIVPPS
jgi:hypothetical protein